MFWRHSTRHTLLWIAAVSLALCAVAALLVAGSRGGGLAFLLAGVLLSPHMQQLIADLRHPLAPARVALFSSITLVPIGLGFVAVDGVAAVDRQARLLGFASAGQLSRAKDLKLPSPQALAAYDAAQQRASIEEYCRARDARRPLACFEPAHQRAATEFVASRLGAGELEAVVRDAMLQQRKTLLAADKQCSDLLDRIDEDAIPVILENRSALIAVAAGGWARHFSKDDLEQLSARSKPGESYISTTSAQGVDQRLAALAPVIEKELDAVLQAWARQIVLSEPGWRTFLKGRTPLVVCGAAQ